MNDYEWLFTRWNWDNGFQWNGTWVDAPSASDDDDGPPTGGVREPRRPRPSAPAGAIALTA